MWFAYMQNAGYSHPGAQRVRAHQATTAYCAEHPHTSNCVAMAVTSLVIQAVRSLLEFRVNVVYELYELCSTSCAEALAQLMKCTIYLTPS
jgi:hypothetical protein